MRTKTFTGVRVKDASQGIVELVFATHLVKTAADATVNDIDKGGDITLKGAYDDGAEVVISAYGHASWALGIGMGGSVPQLPIGKGVIREAGDEVHCEAQFFLDTVGGAETFKTVQGLGDLQEWSYSLQNVQGKRATVGGKSVQVIEKVTVKEISPVLVGEGINTRTLAAKGSTMKMLNSELRCQLDDAGELRWGAIGTYVWLADFDPDAGYAIFGICTDGEPDRYVQVDYAFDDAGVLQLADAEIDVERVTQFAPKSGARFVEHAMTVLAGVKQLTDRAQEVVALRAEKGKAISEDSADLLTQIDTELDALKALIAPTPTPAGGLAPEDAQFLELVALSQNGAIR